MIYLDNAATSLQKPKEVEEAVIRAFHTMGNPGRGAHEATLQAGRCVYQVREQLAELFHAEKGERIAFTSNATEALNTAILGLFHKGDHVITTVCEHNSVLRPLYRLQEEGVEVSFLSADENGVLEYEKLPEACQGEYKRYRNYTCFQSDRKYYRPGKDPGSNREQRFAFGGRRVADGGNFTGGCTETGNRYLLFYRA